MSERSQIAAAGSPQRINIQPGTTIASQLPPNTRIIEGIMATVADVQRFVDDASMINLAPMGPIVDASFSQLTLRPFTSSTTYQNLKATGQGVFHVTDDALLIARGAIGKLAASFKSASQKTNKTPQPGKVVVKHATHAQGVVLADACRAFEFRVTSLDDSQDRTHIEAEVVHRETLREFLGFNRAKHAVLEAAILATRIHLTGSSPVLTEYDKLQVIVDKTGADDEHTAMRELREFVESQAQESAKGQKHLRL